MSTPALPEIPLEAGTAMIGDLHIDPLAAGASDAFVDWLERCEGVPRIVVLGDLFDAWIGPAHGRFPEASRVFGALEARVRAGTALDFIPGNRDFLLTDFDERTGGSQHGAGCVGLDSTGARWLLVHGDELCTLDHGYQRLKRILRSRPIGIAAPRIPTPVALWVARRLRRGSAQAIARKPSEEKAQQPAAVGELTGAHGCVGLVCGHAHVYRDERPIRGGRAGSAGDAGGPRWLGVASFGAPRDVLRVGRDGEMGAESSAVWPPATAESASP